MDNLDEAIKSVGKNVVDEIKKLAIRDGFKNTGKLNDSFYFEEDGNTVTIYGAKYTLALSDGIKKKKLPNVREIKEWVKQKGLRLEDYKGRPLPNTEVNMNRVAFVISKSIERRGISKRFGYKGSGFFDEAIKNTMENIADIIAEAYKLDIIVKLKEI
jgi:hypothetical protein